MIHSNQHAPATRTGQDRLTDALLFVAMARDHVIKRHTAETIATMKGVTAKHELQQIRKALSVRMMNLAGIA